jgi:hypothetical protein
MPSRFLPQLERRPEFVSRLERQAKSCHGCGAQGFAVSIVKRWMTGPVPPWNFHQSAQGVSSKKAHERERIARDKVERPRDRGLEVLSVDESGKKVVCIGRFGGQLQRRRNWSYVCQARNAEYNEAAFLAASGSAFTSHTARRFVVIRNFARQVKPITPPSRSTGNR